MPYGSALTSLSTKDLENLLTRLHRGDLACPIGPRELHAAGLSYLCDKVDFLAGLESRAVHVVLVAVLAERRKLRPSG